MREVSYVFPDARENKFRAEDISCSDLGAVECNNIVFNWGMEDGLSGLGVLSIPFPFLFLFPFFSLVPCNKIADWPCLKYDWGGSI
ncbi:hypothetical protein BDV32DRAFT_122149 [Aspergillus pseudonomiae]|nr:hypothetical protein BDV32DRAFT_122149 [Aspergillus pseudonomiae]